ncbi:MAG TPA: hypothetical protein VMT17_18080 [Anaeromyxobacteraceae bacterium]|nr:hypothetical protein [Anaeromyxobacteraceae bacterium]
MIRRSGFVLAVAAAVLAAPLVRADDSTLPPIGVGVGVNVGNVFSGGSLAASPVNLYVPINLSSAFRLEPSFGYWYVGRGTTVSALNGVSVSKGGYAVDLGVGAFYLIHPTTPFTVYVGGRLGLVFTGFSTVPDPVAGVVTNYSEVDMYVNPTLGLEWAISRNFAFSGEAAPAFRFYFNPSVSAGNASTTLSGSKFGTGFQAVLMLRLYF